MEKKKEEKRIDYKALKMYILNKIEIRIRISRHLRVMVQNDLSCYALISLG